MCYMVFDVRVGEYLVASIFSLVFVSARKPHHVFWFYFILYFPMFFVLCFSFTLLFLFFAHFLCSHFQAFSFSLNIIVNPKCKERVKSKTNRRKQCNLNVNTNYDWMGCLSDRYIQPLSAGLVFNPFLIIQCIIDVVNELGVSLLYNNQLLIKSRLI